MDNTAVFISVRFQTADHIQGPIHLSTVTTPITRNTKDMDIEWVTPDLVPLTGDVHPQSLFTCSDIANKRHLLTLAKKGLKEIYTEICKAFV